jgi:phage gp29-like protein
MLYSLLPRRRSRASSLGARIIRPWRDDSAHLYPTVGLSPSKLLALLQQADAGQPQAQFELFTEMLARWPRLAAVEATRRLALTGLEWEVVPPAAQSADIADFCRRSLESLDAFRDALDHLAAALGFGIAVAELVWQDGRLIDLVPVPHSRLIADPHEPWRLRVRTQESPSEGVSLDQQPGKWIVHRARPAAGRHFEHGLLRASALLYVAQNLSLKDWLIYSQIAGMPIRVAQFDPGTPESDKQQLFRMLETLGTDAVALLSKSVELKLLESSRSGDKPYAALQNYCNTEVTILWLGQHLTTDIRETGSRAAAQVHDRVREDLLVSDIAAEGRTIRRDLLTPLVRSRFGPDSPVPLFRRSLVQTVDTQSLARTLAVAVRDLGLRVPQRWAHQALGIPEPAGAEPTLTTGSLA